ncbi:RidA family protein [Bradyrhizobium niftali]|uniref:hypothetical protein n=1 Tax=Bradyrhizobium niftali TaxID=2560055 RepID=UPI00384CDA86
MADILAAADVKFENVMKFKIFTNDIERFSKRTRIYERHPPAPIVDTSWGETLSSSRSSLIRSLRE